MHDEKNPKKTILQGLNDAQAKAVTFTGVPLLILAGAGSGKTRVLTRKVAWLIEEKLAKPWRILAVTFTNKAAREMMDRLENLLSGDLAGLQVRTFHSFGLNLLFRHREALMEMGYPASCVVYDKADSLSTMKQVLAALNIDAERYSPAWALDQVSRLKNAGLSAPDQSSPLSGMVGSIFEAYNSLLKQRGAWDFDDLIALPVTLLSSRPDVLARERSLLEWILVDEYQDVNAIQYQLMKLLAGTSPHVAAVGDPDQSIYGWRGADISMIMSFERDFEGASVMLLEQNYRSTGHILKASNAVIRHNENRREKELWTARGDGEVPQQWECSRSDDEARMVARHIESFLSRGYRYSDMAVLYRINAMSRAFEQVFMEQGIPYRVVRGTGFFERREVRDVLAWIRLAVNPYDRAALERVANMPPRGLGPKAMEKFDVFIQSHRRPEALDLWRIVEERQGGLTGNAARGATQVSQFMSELLRRSDDIKSVIDWILDGMSYEAEMQRYDPSGWEDRYDNVMEILSIVPQGGSLADMLAQAALYTDADRQDDGEGVNLSSLHGAKGLEFPVVFLVGMEEGIFPHSRCSDSLEELEEERRLCYVGMTRAEERLFLSWARTRYLFGTTLTGRPSRFLREIPEDLKEENEWQEVSSHGGYRTYGRNRSW